MPRPSVHLPVSTTQRPRGLAGVEARMLWATAVVAGLCVVGLVTAGAVVSGVGVLMVVLVVGGCARSASQAERRERCAPRLLGMIDRVEAGDAKGASGRRGAAE